MISSLGDTKSINKLKRALDDADNIVAVTHTNPDGDAIGSTTAFRAVMQRLGKNVNILSPDMVPDSLRSVPGAKDVIDATKYPDFAAQLIEKADLIVCLDFNDLKRIDRLGEFIEKAEAPKVLIDHHLHPGNFPTISISRPEMSSTCFLLFKVICALEMFDYIDRAAATSLLTGMMTDTGNFSYNCSDPEIYIVVAELIRKGADKEKIYREQFETHSLNSIRLNAYALYENMEVSEQFGCAMISLSRNELNRFHYSKGDTEGLVNRPLAIPGIVVSAFLREEDGFVKVSMRSLGNVPANEICSEYFYGGGHMNASGGEFPGSLSECKELFRSIMPEIFARYISKSNRKNKS